MLHNDTPATQRPIEWIGSTKRDLSRFPVAVKRILGQALFEAQCGITHEDAKPMKGHLRVVTEICVSEDGSTYRTVYTTKIGGIVYALHAFNKKATDGVRTPQRHLDLIEQRLKEARKHHERLHRKTRPQKDQPLKVGRKAHGSYSR